jgi:hypothetical protein
VTENEKTTTPIQQVQALYEEAETRTAAAMEEVVSRNSFGEILALVAGNAIAVMKIGSDVADLVVRNLRLAGRRDVIALGRQIARTEDKLELVLQEVESLQDDVRRSRTSSNGTSGEAEAVPEIITP